ncbi:uncharacterized protein A1O9_07600 [Exophiala aquamarina CBS 119918]|uniref:Uncharacterized protein n=1 Tax=Exophiala aquamarina CBS 119918 TaxID=1182545 RepID=A0A072PKG4_9EURO|nr:uncharacterized protein A1O9_07600 [Exophiala aquamarina CBS 119918]KEF56020.1 hypothetical protein A1O9_07600 [Exophiala aquamarina CBS 119918]
MASKDQSKCQSSTPFEVSRTSSHERPRLAHAATKSTQQRMDPSTANKQTLARSQLTRTPKKTTCAKMIESCFV